MSIGIYKITSPSGRIYIGQSVRLETRFEYYRRNSCKQQTRLYASFLKYGWEKHLLEVIEYCEAKELNNRERYWQEFYEVLSKKGLNCRYVKSNDKSGIQSPETIAKKIKSTKGLRRSRCYKIVRDMHFRAGIRKTTKGNFHSQETKDKIRSNHKRPMLGVKHSEKIKFLIGKNSWKIVFDTINGIYYDCLQEVIDLKLYKYSKSNLQSKLNGHYKNNNRFIYA